MTKQHFQPNIYVLFSSKDLKYVPSEQKILIESIAKYQAKLEAVDAYDHVTLPPLYRQVARWQLHNMKIIQTFTLRFSVRVYFLFDLIGDQVKADDPAFIKGIHVPIFLILKFIFFYGWLAVADALGKP